MKRSMTALALYRSQPWLLVLTLLTSACQWSAPATTPASDSDKAPYKAEASYYRPALDLAELFVAVQLGGVFEDSKTFVDSRPMQPPAEILQSYRSARDDPSFDLRAFVLQHFEVPEQKSTRFQSDPSLSMEEHLARHWSYLTREADTAQAHSTLIPLPYPYVVPGGRFREIYYWDSYFTMQGLAASGRVDLVEQMLLNFAWLIDSQGHIPNGNRTYYLSRSQPPFFASMVALYQQHKGSAAAAEFLPQLEAEHRFWMEGSENLQAGESHRRMLRMADGTLLNRYYDDLDTPRPESYREDVTTAQAVEDSERPRLYRDIRAAAESGWDFSSRWLADLQSLGSIETTQIIPVDLNSLLYRLEQLISELHAETGDRDRARAFAARAEARKAAINRWLWNDETQTYGDFHIGRGGFTEAQTLATVYPLYFNIASNLQATAVARQLQSKFLMPGGLVTSLHPTGEQWDYPNGWAPLQWLAVRGLGNYGHQALADEVTSRWLSLNRRVFQETGRMMEKYNVVETGLHAGGGEYPLQDGFGWTNGVALALAGKDNQEEADARR